jgi:hypothetical protein
MPTWMKLAIPIGLGVLAALLNYMGRSAETAPVSYVRLNQDLDLGVEFKEEFLERVDLPKNLGTLEQSAIPYKDRAVLYQRPNPRKLKKGDILLWRDATPPDPGLALREGEVALHLSLEGLSASLPAIIKIGDEIGFYLPKQVTTASPKDKEPASSQPSMEYVGPFRVLSIGKRVASDTPEKSGGFVVDEREITLAIKPKAGAGQPDVNTTRLLLARLSRQESGSQAAVVIIPHARRSDVKAPEKKNADKSNPDKANPDKTK